MNTASASVSIVGAPVACADGVKETWRDLAGWFAGQLGTRYGEQVEVTYYDLFDPACPPLPQDAQLPVVLVNDRVVTSGGKLSMPAIRAATLISSAARLRVWTIAGRMLCSRRTSRG